MKHEDSRQQTCGLSPRGVNFSPDLDKLLVIFWDSLVVVQIVAGQLSEPFQKLLEQLVDQHLAELAERDPKPPPEPPQAG